MSTRRYSAALIAASVFAGCGGGGSGNGDPLTGKQDTYTIGGTVSGLAITAGQLMPSVVVTNTSTTTSAIASLTISGNGAFTFPGAPTGTEYKLSIQPPAGYACAFDLANGNGVVGTTTVTNLSITCAAGTYSLGGIVGGLGSSNAGLILRNNLQTVPIGGDGPFSFVQGIATNTAYNVTVDAAHSHYVCNVANGSGTISSSQITNVAVSCAAPIRVTVVGLSSTGSGLALTNSYTVDSSNTTRTVETLPIAGSGAFAFPTRLPRGRQYAIGIATPHSEANCIVNGGNGDVGIDAINVAITCSAVPSLSATSVAPANGIIDVARDVNPTLGFSALLNASTVTTGSVSLVSAAGAHVAPPSTSGNQIIVTPLRGLLPLVSYTLNVAGTVRGTNNERLASPLTTTFTTRDGQWQPRRPIGSPAAGVGLYPYVAFDSAGNALAAWAQQIPNGRIKIWANRFSAGNGQWGVAAALESDPTGDSERPFIACDAMGNAIAIWSAYDAGNYTVRVSRYRAGIGWDAHEIISSGIGLAQTPQVALDATGNAMAVWQRSNGSRPAIFAARYTVGGSWAAPQEIDNAAGGGSYNPNIKVDAAGKMLAVWAQSNGTREQIWARHFVAATGWDTAVRIGTELTGHEFSPSLAVNAAGNALVAWQHEAGARHRIYANRFFAGNGWGTAVDIDGNSVGTTSALATVVAIDAIGNGIAAWGELDGGPANLRANRFIRTGDNWGTAVGINTPGPGSANAPKLSIDASGNGIAVWVQFDGTRLRAHANRFSPSTGWRTDIVLDPPIPGSSGSLDPHIIIDDRGNAFAAWSGWSGTNYDIFVARFE